VPSEEKGEARKGWGTWLVGYSFVGKKLYIRGKTSEGERAELVPEMGVGGVALRVKNAWVGRSVDHTHHFSSAGTPGKKLSDARELVVDGPARVSGVKFSSGGCS